MCMYLQKTENLVLVALYVHMLLSWCLFRTFFGWLRKEDVEKSTYFKMKLSHNLLSLNIIIECILIKKVCIKRIKDIDRPIEILLQ